MQKHTMALGYFALAVFCVHVSEHISGPREGVLVVMLTMAAALAGVVGVAFFFSATIAHIRSAFAFTAEYVRDTRQPPMPMQPSGVRPTEQELNI